MSQYIPVVITLIVGAVVVGVMVSLNALVGPRSHTPEKDATFECGNLPSGTAWARSSIRFYLVAILFIVFDVEVVFMYPWAVMFRQLGIFGLVEMAVFMGVLALGFVYAWRKGVFEWS